MKALLHIGTEKTGTSSIQHYLFRNRRRLRKAGYHMLQCGGEFNHHAVVACCLSDSDKDDYLEGEGIHSPHEREAFRQRFQSAFAEEMSSLPKAVHTVIFTSEHFQSRLRTVGAIENLQSLLAPWFDEVSVLVYLREQSAMCTSWYSTSLKFGETGLLSSFMARCTPENYYFNHEALLQNWSQVFGVSSIQAAVYERASFVNNDLLDDFTSRIDPALSGCLRKYRLQDNPSLSPPGQALMLSVNRAFPRGENGDDWVALRRSCEKPLERYLSGAGERASLDQCRAVYTLFEPSNNAVLAQYFSGRPCLFSAPSASPPAAHIPISRIDKALKAVLKVVKKHCRSAGYDAPAVAGIETAVSASVSRWLDPGGA